MAFLLLWQEEAEDGLLRQSHVEEETRETDIASESEADAAKSGKPLSSEISQDCSKPPSA
jgi:hypothetical protein